MVEIPS